MNAQQLAERFLDDHKHILTQVEEDKAVDKLDRSFARFVRGILNEGIFAEMPKTMEEKFRAIELVNEMYNEIYERRMHIEKEKLRIQVISEDISNRKTEGFCIFERKWEEKWAKFSVSGKIKQEQDFIHILKQKLEEVEFTYELELLAYEVRSITRGNYLISDITRESMRNLLKEFGKRHNAEDILKGIRGLNLYDHNEIN